jgi:hypothetical protein
MGTVYFALPPSCTCTGCVVLVVASRAVGHLVISDVESALATRICGDKMVLPAALRWVHVSSYRVVSRSLRRRRGGRPQRPCQALSMAKGSSNDGFVRCGAPCFLLAINRLSIFAALWRTPNHPEDSWLSNIRLGPNLVASIKPVPLRARLSR